MLYQNVDCKTKNKTIPSALLSLNACLQVPCYFFQEKESKLLLSYLIYTFGKDNLKYQIPISLNDINN